MKRKKVPLIVLLIILVALILGIVIQWSAPKEIISNASNISAVSVIYHGSKISVDENKLINILNKYSSKRTFENYFPYQTDKIDMEIDFDENNKPKHILLGEFNIWYVSSDRGAFNILNGHKIIDEIIGILE